MLKLIFILLCLFSKSGNLFGALTGNQCNTYPCLIFEDNFDQLNFDVWQHEITASGGGNFEFQYYHNNRRNSYVKDGKLYIKPTLTSDVHGEDFINNGYLDLWGSYPANLCTGNAWNGCERKGFNNGTIIPPVQSARLRSVLSFNYRYGKIEVEAKMPTGDWIWPAIWMLSQHDEYGDWPASGEIDIVEVRGNRNLRAPDGSDAGINQAGQTMHWGPRRGFNGFELTHASKNLPDKQTFGTGFHRFQVEWGPNIGLRFYIDDEHMFTANPNTTFWEYGRKLWPNLEEQHDIWRHSKGRLAPFDKPFHIIMNVAIGGTVGYFGDDLVNFPYPKPWRNDEANPMLSFYKAKHLWYPTWKDENDETAMQVNYVKVWKMEADPDDH